VDEEDEKVCEIDSDPHLIVLVLVSFPGSPALAWE